MKFRMYSIALAGLACISQAAKADAVLDWNKTMQDALVGQNVLVETRIAAITQLAVFEAVNSITREYKPYVGYIPAPSDASTDAAAIAAAHAVLKHHLPAKAAMLDEARDQSLEIILDGYPKNSGLAVGEAAAAAMIQLRANDGSAPLQWYMPTSNKPGEWQLTPSCPAAGGVFAHWGTVQPFGFDSITPYRLPPPPALKSKRYAEDYNEVKRVGSRYSTERPLDRADVARFYAVVLTIRTWNPVATQIAIAQGRSQTHTARAFALINMAMSDALVAVYHNKYAYTFWRPETAIRNGDSDGNARTQGDPTFEPFITSPCFPSYASAHATGAYAARHVVERIYGPKHHSIKLTSTAVPDVTLHYSAIAQITYDIDDARVYGGIHFRFDQELGARLGERVAQKVYRENLRRRYGKEME
jgi:hypothetical protein